MQIGNLGVDLVLMLEYEAVAYSREAFQAFQIVALRSMSPDAVWQLRFEKQSWLSVGLLVDRVVDRFRG